MADGQEHEATRQSGSGSQESGGSTAAPTVARAYALDFEQISLSDLAQVGGKNASLGELFRALKPKGVGVVDGFATTAAAYRRLLLERDLEMRLHAAFDAFDPENLEELASRGHRARAAVLETPLPDEVRASILAAYERLSARLGREPELAVRSSATAEDLPEASFAGAAETFLNVRGREGLLRAVPSNVLLAEDFLRVFDGYSIGSNDLTQLTLGIDRDSGTVARLFDERNEAVRRMIGQAIRAAKRAGKPIGICGQAPSDYPEFAEWLVSEGIDSISLNPDVAIATAIRVAAAESSPGRRLA